MWLFIVMILVKRKVGIVKVERLVVQEQLGKQTQVLAIDLQSEMVVQGKISTKGEQMRLTTIPCSSFHPPQKRRGCLSGRSRCQVDAEGRTFAVVRVQEGNCVACGFGCRRREVGSTRWRTSVFFFFIYFRQNSQM